MAQEIRAAGGDACFAQADVSNLARVKAMAAFTIETYGRLDILFNNAGFPCAGAIEATEDDDYERGMDTNVKGAFFAAKYAIAQMLAQGGGGSILFTSSTAGIVASVSSPLYGTAKTALVGLVRSLGARYAAQGIRVNAIAPGPTATAMIAGFASRPGQEMETQKFEAAVKGVPPHATIRRPRGIGQRGPVPRIRQGFVHHRRDPAGRWRNDGGLKRPAQIATAGRTACVRPLRIG